MDNPLDKLTECTGTFRRLSLHHADLLGHHHVHIQQGAIFVHPWFEQQNLATPVWCYDGEMPGKLIEVSEGDDAHVYYENHLPMDAQNPMEAHINPPADPTPVPPPAPHDGMHGHDGTGMGHAGHMGHGAWIKNGLNPELLVHLHGAVVEPRYDGNPGNAAQIVAPGERVLFKYPNKQRAALLWYHDHSMGQTAGTVYAGLAAPYIIRGRRELELAEHFGLPSGHHEVAVVIQDKEFELDVNKKPTGRFSYSIDEDKEFAGTHFLVNGRLRPRAKVEARPYRVRILNACNGRFLKLWLQDENSKLSVNHIQWIGTDGGLLPEAVPADNGNGNGNGIFLPPAGRADLVIDFSKLATGSYKVVNQVAGFPNPYNNGQSDSDPKTEIEVLMQVDVVAAVSSPVKPLNLPRPLCEDLPKLPDVLAKLQADGTVIRPVEMNLQEIDDPMNPGHTAQFINSKHFEPDAPDPTNETFAQGEWVRLKIKNHTPDAHPIHLHLVSYWVLDRRAKKPDGNGMIVDDSEFTYFKPVQENGLIDTVWCPPGGYRPKDTTLENGGPNLDAFGETTLLIYFPTDAKLVGTYMFHCHILEHEDHDMMRPFAVNAGPLATTSNHRHDTSSA